MVPEQFQNVQPQMKQRVVYNEQEPIRIDGSDLMTANLNQQINANAFDNVAAMSRT